MRQSNIAELNNDTNKHCIVEQWDKQILHSWTIWSQPCIVEQWDNPTLHSWTMREANRASLNMKAAN